MDATGDRRRLLARLLDDRRLALGLTWRQVADRGGISTEALRALRLDNAGVSDLTAAGVERALGLAPRSIRRFLESEADDLPLAQAATPTGLPPIAAANWDDPGVRELWALQTFTAAEREAMIRRHVTSQGPAGNNTAAEGA